MRDSVYYLKAMFPRASKALLLLGECCALLDDVMEFEEDVCQNLFQPYSASFVESLLAQHPRAASLVSYLPVPAGGWTVEALSRDVPTPRSYDFEVQDRTLYVRLVAYAGANWSPLEQWLLDHGATATGWISEIQLAPFQRIFVA